MDTREIVKRAGGVVRVSAELGLAPSSVSVWTRVPPRHARTVAKLAGLHPSDVRPDLYDPPDRDAA